jgi:hypothetical protein
MVGLLPMEEGIEGACVGAPVPAALPWADEPVALLQRTEFRTRTKRGKVKQRTSEARREKPSGTWPARTITHPAVSSTACALGAVVRKRARCIKLVAGADIAAPPSPPRSDCEARTRRTPDSQRTTLETHGTRKARGGRLDGTEQFANHRD